MPRVIRSAFLVTALLLPFVAAADVFRPAYLEIRELGEDRYAVLWRLPAGTGVTPPAATVRLPKGTQVLDPPRVELSDGHWIERYRVRRPRGFAGQAFVIEGSTIGVTDMIARLERLDGSSQVERLNLDEPRFVIKSPRGPAAVARSYFVIGVEHILAGIDHLLFVFALLLIVRGIRKLVATVTAFTVAHSLTLAAATLGWVNVPAPPVEAIIALSIVFVASEILHAQRGRSGITERSPWLVAFIFGLLHGFGFAGALADVGLPQASIPLALLAFNLGVEVGQLLFVGSVQLLRAVGSRRLGLRLQWLPTAAAYAMGSVAAFWTVERVVSFWDI